MKLSEEKHISEEVSMKLVVLERNSEYGGGEYGGAGERRGCHYRE